MLTSQQPTEPRAAAAAGRPKRRRSRRPIWRPARGSWPRRQAAELLAPFLLAAALVTVLAYTTLLPARAYAFGAQRPPERARFVNFHDVERIQASTFRWSKPEAAIVLPVDRPGRYRVTLTLQDSPAVQPARTVTIYADGRAIGTAALGDTPREYPFDFTLPPAAWARDGRRALTVEMATPPYHPPGDPRALGVNLTRVAVAPAGPAGLLWPAFVWGLLLLATGYASCRAVTRSWRGAAAMTGPTVAAFGLLAATNRPAALYLALRPSAGPTTFLLLLVGLAALARVAAVDRARFPLPDRRALRPYLVGLALVASATTALTWLAPGLPDRIVTTLLLAGVFGAAYSLLAWGVDIRGALAGTAVGWIVLVPLLASRSGSAAVAASARAGEVWLLLCWIAGGLLVLTLAGRRARRPWLALLAYAAATAGLAAWWRWGGPQAAVVGLAGLPPLERDAAALFPAAVAVGGAGLCCLALLLPGARWRRCAGGDIAALLMLLGLPVGARLLAARPVSPPADEARLRIAWLAAPLVALILLRAAIVLRLLWRHAAAAGVGDRRLAAGLLVCCLMVYLPAGAWRLAALGLTGDEPQYLAATMSLWRHHNLDLPRSVFSPEMRPLVAFPDSDLRADVYEERSRDLLSLVEATPPRTVHDVPLAADAELGARVAVMHTSTAPVDVTIRYHDAGGNDVGTTITAVGPNRVEFLASPAGASGPLSARVEAAAPVSVSVRLRDGGELESYNPGQIASGQCIPIQVGAGWSGRLLLHNANAGPVASEWQLYNRDGVAVAAGRLALPPKGHAIAPVALGTEPGAVCATADRPIAALLIARGQPGLVALTAPLPQALATAIPEPPRAPSHTVAGSTGLLVHNPAEQPVSIVLRRPAGPVDAITLAPHATAAVLFAVPAGSQDSEFPTGQIEPGGPVVVAVASRLDAHAALLARTAPAAPALVLPVYDDGGDDFNLAQLALTNPGPTETVAKITTRNAAGGIVAERQLRLCATCTGQLAIWSADGGLVSVTADRPITGALLQREIHARWPVRNLGLSLVMLPGYAVGGARGALATVAVMAAALAATVFGLFRRCGVAPRAALLGAAALALSPPLSSYATQLYAEIGGTLLLCLALLFLHGALAGRRRDIVGLVLCAAGAPAFHSRFLPLVLVLFATAGLLAARRAWRARAVRVAPRHLALAGVPIGLLGLAFAFVLARDPRVRPDYLARYLALDTLHHHTLGILLDRATGLLPGVPVLILAGGGFWLLLRHRPALGWPVLAVTVTHLALVALRQSGWEAWGPPGRYVLPVVPLLGLAAGIAWARDARPAFRAIALALAFWGVMIGALYAWMPFSAYYSVAPPYSFGDAALRYVFGGNPLRLFPSLRAGYEPPGETILRWTVVLVTAVVLSLPWPVFGRTRRLRSTPVADPTPGA